MNKSNAVSMFSLKATESELKRQVDYYDTLKPWQSFRGISALLLCLSILVTLGAAFFGFMFTFEEAIIEVVVLAVLAIFVYRGSKIALILAALYWTISKVMSVVGSPSPNLLVILIWWWLYVSYFYKAWQVEKIRSEIKKETGAVSQ